MNNKIKINIERLDNVSLENSCSTYGHNKNIKSYMNRFTNKYTTSVIYEKLFEHGLPQGTLT